jgi:hypothetical protein
MLKLNSIAVLVNPTIPIELFLFNLSESVIGVRANENIAQKSTKNSLTISEISFYFNT